MSEKQPEAAKDDVTFHSMDEAEAYVENSMKKANAEGTAYVSFVKQLTGYPPGAHVGPMDVWRIARKVCELIMKEKGVIQ